MNARVDPLRQTKRAASTDARRGVPMTSRLLVWHRRLGLAAALIVLFLAVTGLLLNHADRLRLDEIELRPSWLLEWYGFPPIAPPVAYQTGGRWVSWFGSRLYLGDRAVMEAAAPPVGAVSVDADLIAVAFTDLLALVSTSGEVVERMGPAAIPGRIERVGTLGSGALAVATPAGVLAADADLIAWHRTDASPQWAAAEVPPAALRERLLRAERGPGLPAERVLLDLHSGRIFGAWGPRVMDAAAIAFVVLAITGIGNWWRRQGRGTRSSPRRRDGKGKR